MANGDAASAAGLAVFASTQDARQGYDNDNIRGDELGNHMTNGGHPWSKISDKPATYPAATGSVDTAQLVNDAVTGAKIASNTITAGNIAANAVGSSELASNSVDTNHIDGRAIGTDQIGLGAIYGGLIPNGGIEPGKLAYETVNTGQLVDGAVTADKIDSSVDFDEADRVTSGAYSRQAGGSRYAMWMDGDRLIGRATSSRRYKSEIEAHDIDPEVVLSLQPVTYQHQNDPQGVREFGLIAEDVHDAGLPEIVTWYADKIDGIRYDQLGVALLSVVKAQAAQIKALSARLDALENPTETEEV
ncbi:tail fiber domain-containing protein [Cellulosimicrobium arenosum]|uniref:Tail fiber domain-containing protein n=1 Tax=Cellulosimicrobium arenosum TaxID=2708133 RepID=A0A927G6Z2_9MICO|nr:tail fiber domain-containing protein [Cellulosimicrobium arenosum]MBD8077700.1 tail fiber domain-containing protein [Cellulosimicrobium arenosum]